MYDRYMTYPILEAENENHPFRERSFGYMYWTIKGLNKEINSFSFSYKLRVNKTVAVVYSCVGQAVIVIIIFVSVKFEQCHISSENNKESLIKTKMHICFYLVHN